MKISVNIFHIALGRDHECNMELLILVQYGLLILQACNFSYLYLHFIQDVRDKWVQVFEITNNDSLLTIVVVNVSYLQ